MTAGDVATEFRGVGRDGLLAEIARLRAVVARVGVCARCEGTGDGEPEYVDEHVAVPSPCPDCAGGGSEAFRRGQAWAEDYYRAISDCPKELPLYEHILKLSGFALTAFDSYECAECSQKPGAPTLCARCLDARARAGSVWRGPLPSGGAP